MIRILGTALAVAGAAPLMVHAPAQEELWRVWPQIDGYADPWPYDDLNGDGVNDVIVMVWSPGPPSFQVVRILSGRDGSLLHQRPCHGAAQGIFPVGDVDGDGRSEFAAWIAWGSAAPNLLEVYSLRKVSPLWSSSGLWIGSFGRMTIGLNLDDDANNEIVTSTSENFHSTLYAHDHDGALLYSINLLANNEWLRGLGAVGDIDNDGAEDFGAGVFEATTRGAVQLYSGRTGAPIRRDLGTQVFDVIGHQVAAIGDFDRDGVPDYATSNRFGARGVCTVFSGATGQVLREWTGDQGIAERLLAGRDYDLDGVPDAFFGGPRVSNDPILYNYIGRVQAVSGRDGGLLWDERNSPTNHEPGVYTALDRALGQRLADIGPLPGNPYPVVVVWDWPYRIIGPGPMIQRSPRLRALRVGLAGTAVTGTGCASSGSPPHIALRNDSGSLRVTLSGASPNAFAWLLVGPRAATSWQGLPLPYSLASWSLPGCDLLVPPDLIFSRVTGTSGHDRGYALVTAPFSVATTGLGLAAQWYCFDPATLDYAMSPRHEFAIQ